MFYFWRKFSLPFQLKRGKEKSWFKMDHQKTEHSRFEECLERTVIHLSLWVNSNYSAEQLLLWWTSFWGTSLMCINIWWDMLRRWSDAHSQWCPVAGGEGVGTSWNTGSTIWAQENSFCCDLLWQCMNAGTGYPEELWSLHLWRSTKPVWAQSWEMWETCPGCSSLEQGSQGEWLPEIHSKLSNSVALW